MAALLYLIDTLLSLAQLCFLLRLLLQWARADFRNPLSRAIVQLTSPVLSPLRRLLPAIGRLDTASVVVVIALALLRVSMGTLLSGLGFPPLLWLLELATLQILRLILWTYFFAIALYAALSFIAPGTYSPAQALLSFVVRTGFAAVSQANSAIGQPRSFAVVGWDSHSSPADPDSLGPRRRQATLTREHGATANPAIGLAAHLHYLSSSLTRRHAPP